MHSQGVFPLRRDLAKAVNVSEERIAVIHVEGEERVKFDRHAITTRSWADYPILVFAGVPDVDVALIDRPTERPLGAGEAAQGPTAAAIANALYNATGRRIRNLPLAPERVKTALDSP